MRVLKVMLCMSIFFSFSTFQVFAEGNSSNGTVGTKYELYEKPLTRSVLSIETGEQLGKETGEELAAFQYIKTKTNAPYEIALAHANGDYSYVEQSNNLDEAIEKVNKMNVTDKSTQPVVVSKEGLVVYAEQSMGQVVKIKDGKIYPKDDIPVKVFREKDSTTEHMSINHLFIDDVPVLVDRGTRARVEISGYVGWLNKDPKANEQDLVVVPLNQVVNPSRYYVKGGKLIHYISRNLKVKGEGNEVNLGPAPSFMEAEKTYYSYDGMYFYEDLSTLINDTPDGEHVASINKDNPYYNYYMYLPFRTETNYTAQELNNYIKANTPDGSKLRNIGAKLIELQGKYGVNALTILAVAMNESAKGTSKLAIEHNNFFGIEADDANPGNAKSYTTPEACLEDFAKTYISKGYSDPQDSRYQGGFLGNKYLGANVMYATDPYWGEKAAMYAYLADYSLRDFNFYQLASIDNHTSILNSTQNTLYNLNIIPSFSYFHGGTIASLVTNTPVKLGNSDYYEMVPERHTPVSQGEFQGEYRWNSRGYVNSNVVTMINKGTLIDVKGVTDVQTTVTGKTQPNGVVHVTSNNVEIGKSTASDTGKFSVPISKQKEGTSLVVYMTKGSTQSKKVTLKVTDGIAPAKPTVNQVFDKDTIVTGTAEANSTVYVKVGTSVKGSAKADAKGKYGVKIPTQKGGTTLTIYAQDAAKNISVSQTIKVINTAITVKTVKVTDMKKYDGGKNQLTFINGKGYSQFFYENTSGNYQFVPSSWLKAAGLTVEVKIVNGKKFLFINNPYLSSTPGKVTAPPTMPSIAVKTTKVTDMKKYDGGSNSLTFINGKAYSQFFYENNSGNYQFVPSSWLKAAGLTVEVKKTGSVKRLYITNPYKK